MKPLKQTSFKPYKEITLDKYLSTSTSEKEPEPETVYLSGRTVLVTQAIHIKADISAARGILQRLLADKSTDSDRDKVTSISPIVGSGGVI